MKLISKVHCSGCRRSMRQGKFEMRTHLVDDDSCGLSLCGLEETSYRVLVHAETYDTKFVCQVCICRKCVRVATTPPGFMRGRCLTCVEEYSDCVCDQKSQVSTYRPRKKEETIEGFHLITNVITLARNKMPYRHLLPRLKEISARDGEVMSFVQRLIKNLSK